jgi:hypothetical protein
MKGIFSLMSIKLHFNFYYGHAKAITGEIYTFSDQRAKSSYKD